MTPFFLFSLMQTTDLEEIKFSEKEYANVRMNRWMKEKLNEKMTYAKQKKQE